MLTALNLRLFAPAMLLALAGCESRQVLPPTPIDAFWSALQTHCGKAYAGGLVSDDARDAGWADKDMVAHFAECSDERIAIAFHVESDMEYAVEQPVWDRSRTWVVTRTTPVMARGGGISFLDLRHDHRHEDGSADAVTMYGGVSDGDKSARGVDFPVDPRTIALFEREELDASLTNVWRLEVDPASTTDARLAYQLTRRNDPTRLLRVEFDAASPVAAPPPAWGWE